MTAMTPEWAEVIRDAIRAALLECHTGLPAKVVSFDASIPSVSAQPLLVSVFVDDNGDENVERLPQIQNVPVIYPGSEDWVFDFPLRAGDIVFLAFAERSLDKWLIAAPGLEVDPEHSHHHDLSDAIAIPGLRPRTASRPVTDNLRIKSMTSDAEVLLKPDGTLELNGSSIKLGASATQKAVLGDALSSWLASHTHAVTGASESGGSVTGTAAGPGAPSGILSGKVKVE
jgi:hypothetical protein